MTTYRSGHEPASSPASWYDIGGTTRVVVCAHDLRIEVEDIEADRVCRAFHVEALARQYVAACVRSEEMRDSDPFIETEEGRARAHACDAAHAALFEALR